MNILQMNGKKCIEILDGNDAEQCHKINAVEFDKLTLFHLFCFTGNLL